MIPKKGSKRFIVMVFVLVLLVSACGGGGSQPSAGKWEGTADFGTLVFTVNSAGDQVTYLEITLPKCGSYSITSTFEGAWKGFPIADGEFSYDNTNGLVLEGTFAVDGLSASGEWSYSDENCSYSGPFEAEFVE